MTGGTAMQSGWIPQGSPQRPSFYGPPRTPMFKNNLHFCRVDFHSDEWLCRICDRFDRNSHKPVVYRKREAIKHETTREHQRCVEQLLELLNHHPSQLEKFRQCEMGWSPKGDPLFPNEVYDKLMWSAPDVRKSGDFVNQFVTFWMDDVEAALNEPEPEKVERASAKRRGKGRGSVNIQVKRQPRPTFEEFFEAIEMIPETWDLPFENVYGEDGWGIPADPETNEAADKTAKQRKDEPEGEGWVVQKGKVGKARGKKRIERQPRPKEKVGTKKPTANQNVFAQLQVDEDSVS